MLERAASNNRDISRDDFYNIMTRRTFGANWLDANNTIINIYFGIMYFDLSLSKN
jgi:hypothetical protein